MAKEKPTPRTTPSKPPKGVGGGGAEKKSSATPAMDSGTGKILQMEAQIAALEAANCELKELLAEARRFPRDFHKFIRSAPTAWHLQSLVIDVINRLRYQCEARGKSENVKQTETDLMADPHYAVARIAAALNVSLTAKSTPSWLFKLKNNPAFEMGRKLWRRTKGSHDGSETTKELIINEDDGTRLKVTFQKDHINYEWLSGDEVIRVMKRDRISSKGVLLNWVSGTLYEFDKGLDYPSAPLSKNWSERWADEDVYLTQFLPYAEQEWNDEGIEKIQIYGAGLLRANAGTVQTKTSIGRANDGTVRTRYGLRKTQPRQEFKDFVPDIKRLAKRQLKIWRDSIAGPVLK